MLLRISGKSWGEKKTQTKETQTYLTLWLILLGSSMTNNSGPYPFIAKAQRRMTLRKTHQSFFSQQPENETLKVWLWYKKAKNKRESFITEVHTNSYRVEEAALLTVTRNSACVQSSVIVCFFWQCNEGLSSRLSTLLKASPALSPPTVPHRSISTSTSDRWPALESSSLQHQRLCSSHFASFHLWKIRFGILWYKNVSVCLNEEECLRAAMNARVIRCLVTLWLSIRGV